jgi:hypothetical protein
MKKLALSLFALVMTLAFCAVPADAASSKKKKETKKEEKKKEEKKEVRHYSSAKEVIEGGNLMGRPGYFFADTATTLNKGQVMFAGHLTFDTWGSVFQIPVGGSFGITDKLQLNANTSFYSVTGASGLSYLNFGGKYGFTTQTKGLGIAGGLDLGFGPLSNALGNNVFSFDPYGVVTYTLPDGLQLNGKLGIYVQTYGFDIGPVHYSGSYSFMQLDLGLAYPFSSDLTGFGELATNGVVQGGGLGGTPLLVGIRTGHDVQFQCFGGLDFGGATGAFIGGGIVLMSK